MYFSNEFYTVGKGREGDRLQKGVNRFYANSSSWSYE